MIQNALSSDAALYVYALLLGLVGLAVASLCLMAAHANPQEMRVRTVVVHLVISSPLLYGAGLLLTAAMLGNARFAYVFDIGQVAAVPFALVGAIVCVAPAVLALVERRKVEQQMEEFNEHLAGHFKSKPWKLESRQPAQLQSGTEPAASPPSLNVVTLDTKPEPVAADLALSRKPGTGRSTQLHRVA